ncbi:unnamed protein product [Cuscuta europaea]|uniref:Uncharacterized protein n=1 Tax=Cuscuta europaea TaxID=41803 RepID=A0A9P1E976_CUSEU|nr:unnamed protein product [Cuscuta europaea]
MVASEDKILKLFDSCWFERQILSTKNCSFHVDESDEARPVNHNHEPKAMIVSVLALKVRSHSDNLLGFKTNFSPRSDSMESVIDKPELEGHMVFKKRARRSGLQRKRAAGNKLVGAKSLSELELEELKGFMDLGFVFTDEDKKSSLATIVPGLQRWGSRGSRTAGEDDGEGGGGEEAIEDKEIRRPYLSEAWSIMDQRKIIKKLLKWRFPAHPCNNNESSMKDNLKFWAQTVASALR